MIDLPPHVETDLEEAFDFAPEDYKDPAQYETLADALAAWFQWNGCPVSYLETVLEAIQEPVRDLRDAWDDDPTGAAADALATLEAALGMDEEGDL